MRDVPTPHLGVEAIKTPEAPSFGTLQIVFTGTVEDAHLKIVLEDYLTDYGARVLGVDAATVAEAFQRWGADEPLTFANVAADKVKRLNSLLASGRLFSQAELKKFSINFTLPSAQEPAVDVSENNAVEQRKKEPPHYSLTVRGLRTGELAPAVVEKRLRLAVADMFNSLYDGNGVAAQKKLEEVGIAALANKIASGADVTFALPLPDDHDQYLIWRSRFFSGHDPRPFPSSRTEAQDKKQHNPRKNGYRDTYQPPSFEQQVEKLRASGFTVEVELSV